MNSFGNIKETIYEINNWQQLVGIKSTISEDIKLSVNHYNNDIIDGIVINIYYATTLTPLATFMVSGTDKGKLKYSDIGLSIEEALVILNKFGFRVTWLATEPKLTEATQDFLVSVYRMGLTYLRVHKPDICVMLYRSQNSEEFIDAKMFPAYNNCDFSKFTENQLYNIENLITTTTIPSYSM